MLRGLFVLAVLVTVSSVNGQACAPATVADTCAVSRWAGSLQGSLDGVYRLSAQFSSPSAAVLTSDSSDLFVSDSDNHVIRRIDTATGTVNVLAGGFTSGYTEGASPKFQSPSGVALSSDDSTLYVADTGNNRVRSVAVSTGVSTLVAGSGAVAVIDDVAEHAAFEALADVAVNSDSSVLYVLDGSNLRSITLATNHVSTLSSAFTAPSGVASYKRYVYVADTGADEVRVYDTLTGSLSTLASVDSPVSVEAMDYGRRVLVGTATNQLVVIDTTSGFASTVAGSALTAGNTDGNCVSAATFDGLSCAVAGGTTWYVCDKNNHLIRSVAVNSHMPTCTVETVMGGSAGDVDGLPSIARVSSPFGLALSGAGDFVYLSDSGNHKLRAFQTSTSLMLTMAGTGAPGSDDGVATLATFNTPAGLAMSSDDGTLFIADSGNGAVRALAVSSGFGVTTIATGLTGVSGLAAMNDPTDGEVVFALHGHQVSRVVVSSGATSTLCGGGSAGFTDGHCSVATFDSPSDAVIVGDFLYVTDSGNNALRCIHLSLNVASTFVGSVSGVAGWLDGVGNDARLSAPTALSVSSTGLYLYFTDSGSGTTRAMEIASRRVITLAGNGTPGHDDEGCGYASIGAAKGVVPLPTGNADYPDYLLVADTTVSSLRSVFWRNWAFGEAVSPVLDTYPMCDVHPFSGSAAGLLDGYRIGAQHVAPFGIAVTSTEDFAYVSDRDAHVIRQLDLSTGFVTTVAGTTFGFADGAATSVAAFRAPEGVALATGSSVLYIADSGNNRVRGFNIGLAAVFTVAGDGTAALTDGTGTGAQFNQPHAMTLANDPTDGDVLFVVGAGNAIRRVVVSSGVVTTYCGTGNVGFTDGACSSARFDEPHGITVFGTTLYVADTGNLLLRAIDMTSDTVASLAGAGVTGWVDGIGFSSLFATPVSVAVLPSGNSLVIGEAAGRVRLLDITTRAVSTLAGGATPGTSTGTCFETQLTSVTGMYPLTSGEEIFLVDTGGHYVRQLELNAEALSCTVETLTGSDQAYFDTLFAWALFERPHGIAMAADNSRAYVTDQGAHVIRILTFASNIVSTIAGSAYASGSTDGTGSSARFDSPAGVALSPSSPALYICDSGNDAIRVMDIGTGAVSTISKSVALQGPMGIVVMDDPTDGDVLFVTGTLDVIHRIVASTGATTTFCGTGASGHVDAHCSLAQFGSLSAIAASGSLLYVADAGNDVVRVVDTATGTVTTLQTSGDSFGSPTALSVTSSGNYLIVASGSGTSVVTVDLADGTARRLTGTDGTTGSRNGLCAYGEFSEVTAFAVVESSSSSLPELIAVDAGNTRIRSINTMALTTPVLPSPAPACPSPSATASPTPSISGSPSATPSPSKTATSSTSMSHTSSSSGTPSMTPSSTATPSTTSSISMTPTHSPTSSVTPSPGSSHSSTSSMTPSATASSSPSSTPSPSGTKSATPSSTATPSGSATTGLSPSATASATATPSMTPSTSAPPPVYFYVTTEWSSCTAPCGGGMQYRSGWCSNGAGVEVDASFCGGPPQTQRTCNGNTCPPAHWSVSGSRGPCSSPCMDGTPESLGLYFPGTTTVCIAAGIQVSNSVCELSVGPAPNVSNELMPCNRFPCASSVYLWQTGEWSGCASDAGCGPGMSTRTVVCVDNNGVEADATMCTGPRPDATEPCDSGACVCSSTEDCGAVTTLNGRGVCNTTAGTCGCSDQWSGYACDIPSLIIGDPSIPMCAGAVDKLGTCCNLNAVDAVTGECCPDGAVTDAEGRCCTSHVDKCGVCGGTGVAVDYAGTCCSTPLLPSGLCCTDAIDDCQVCGGVSECLARVSMPVLAGDAISLAAPLLNMTALHHELAGLQNVSPDLIQNLAVQPATPVGADGTVIVSYDLSPSAARHNGDIVYALTAHGLPALDNGVSFAAPTIDRILTCGNDVCEASERCTDQTCSTGCAADCPVMVSACPTDAAGQECGGHGSCMYGVNSCDCFLGYTGAACDVCNPGLTQSVGGACVFVAGYMSICANGIMDFGETGVDCGGPHCRECTLSGIDGRGVAVGGSDGSPIGYIAIGVVAVAALVIGVLYVRNKKKKKEGKNKVAPQPAVAAANGQSTRSKQDAEDDHQLEPKPSGPSAGDRASKPVTRPDTQQSSVVDAGHLTPAPGPKPVLKVSRPVAAGSSQQPDDAVAAAMALAEVQSGGPSQPKLAPIGGMTKEPSKTDLRPKGLPTLAPLKAPGGSRPPEAAAAAAAGPAAAPATAAAAAGPAPAASPSSKKKSGRTGSPRTGSPRASPKAPAAGKGGKPRALSPISPGGKRTGTAKSKKAKPVTPWW